MSTENERVFSVKGMHCASCEILMEKKLLDIKNIKSVDASTSKGRVVIEYKNKCPDLNYLNQLFKEDNYIFSEPGEKKSYVIEFDSILKTVGISILVISAFFGLNYLGLGKYANVNAGSSLPSFFVLGLIAGVSSCAALVGGLVLSMSKKWYELYPTNKSKKMKPHILFNVGRLASYGFFGFMLGIIGEKLQFSPKFSIILVLAISIMMIILALQMLGIRAFKKLQIALPKFITRKIANENNFEGRYMPIILGASTFFLPCGFTITAQGIALISGSALQGMLIMLAFALGTAPALLAIGLSSVKFISRPHLAEQFTKIAGIIIIFFAIYNINAQMAILGWKNINDIFAGFKTNTAQNDTVQITGDKQVVKINASARGYDPDYIKVKVGIPVRLEVTDTGTSGCTNAIISKLFSGTINLTPGKTSIKEFTPQKTGKYKFSCWMGMVSGTIEVIK